MDKWIKMMWEIYTVEYYSATKKDEILPSVTTWMDLEGIMLREISQNKTNTMGFPGGAVVKNPPANAADTGSSPGPGRSHMPWSN